MRFLTKNIKIIVIAYATLLVSILFHEWGHSITAFIFGIKSNPFDIQYSYKPFFMGISENVNCNLAATLPSWQAILIAFAGLLVNFIFALLSFIILRFSYKKISKWASLIFYCLFFWNVNDWLGYMVVRNIFPRDDIANMITFGFPHAALLAIGLITSAVFLYMLFYSANKILFDTFDLDYKNQKKILRAIIITIIVTQLVILYNSLFMY
ncbi:site-2 protease family protein [Candidatus Dependentiae bacterium]